MSRLTRLLLIVGITLHLTWYILLWTQLINHPQYLKQSDFATFYITGQLAQRKGYDSIYNLELERAATEKLSGYPVHIGDYLTFNHPPLLVPILEAIVDSDYFASFQRWGGVLFLFQAASIYLLTRFTTRSGMGTQGNRGYCHR